MIVEPMLATTGPLPTGGERRAFEPKWDGFRAVVQRDGRRPRVMSRRATDLAGRLPELKALAEVLPAAPPSTVTSSSTTPTVESASTC